MSSEHGPIAELEADIVACLQVGAIPAISGPPGVGKTALIEAIAARLGMRLVVLVGSTLEPADVTGFPVVTPGVLVADAGGHQHPVLQFAPRRWLVEADADARPTLVFVDELTTAPGGVRNALLTFMTGRRAGDFVADPAKVGVATAYNPPDVAIDGQELGLPMLNRLTHFEWPTGDAVRQEWLANFIGYWGRPRVVRFGGHTIPEDKMIQARGLVVQFLHAMPDLWYPKLPADGGAAGFPTPRSWDRVSWHLGWAIHHGHAPIDAGRRVAGEVGPGAAAAFLTYLREASLPDPEALLAAPTTYTPTGRVDVDFATTLSVAAAVDRKPTAQRVLAGLTVVERAVRHRGETGPAYEAAMAAIPRLTKYILPSGQAKLLEAGATPADVGAFVAQANARLAPFAALTIKLRGPA